MKKLWLILCAVVAILIKVLKFLYRLITKHLVEAITNIGLYVPGGYLLYCVLLKAYAGLDLKIPELRNLFFVGLGLSIVCCVIMGIRHYVILPIKEENARPTRTKRRNKPQDYLPEPRSNNERPLIYRSRIYPELTVYEYHDRFDLYKRINGSLKLVGVEYKD